MKRLTIDFPVHVRVGEKDLRGATLCNYRQHSRLLKLFDGLRSKDHRRFVLAPGFLRLYHVIANRLVLDEEPRFVEQEDLEGVEVLRVSDLIRRAMQNVKQKRLKNFRRIIPAVEIERLKAFERKCVLGIVEEEAVLPTAGPTVEAFFQLT